MSEVKAVSEAAYVSKLALQRMPFSPVTVPNEFFNGRHIRQCLMLVLHALRATSIPVFVQGESGLGKTTLAQQLQWDGGDSLRFIEVTPESTIDSLATALINQNNWALSTPDDELLVERLLQLRRRSNTLPVLLIDDLEAISPQIIAKIKVWLSWDEEEHKLVQAVFTGKNKDILGDLEVQQMDLPLLTGDEVGVYLLYRLRAVEYEGDNPFSEKVIVDIADRSEGIPAKINALGHQFLLNGKLTSVTPASSKVLVKWLPILILAVIAAVAVINKQQIFDWFNTVIKSIESQDKISADSSSENNQLAKVNAGDSAQIVKDDAAARKQLAELLAKIPSEPDDRKSSSNGDEKADGSVSAPDDVTSITKPVEQPVEQNVSKIEEPATQKQTKPLAVISENSGTKSPLAVEEKHAKQKQVKPSETAVNKGSLTIHDTSWIMMQSPQKYTYQMIGTYDEAHANKFIKQYSLTGPIAKFSSLRKGKVWYVVTYGVYFSRSDALAAHKKWRGAKAKLKPWLRSYRSVQKQITQQ